jgi:hypothetical protein
VLLLLLLLLFSSGFAKSLLPCLGSEHRSVRAARLKPVSDGGVRRGADEGETVAVKQEREEGAEEEQSITIAIAQEQRGKIIR